MPEPEAARPTSRLVSVIIPTYNEAAHIARVVPAVRAQRTQGVEIEVLVADDGSSDDTLERARVAGARALPLPAGASGGNPGAARNRGVAASQGDPLIFLDADCVPEHQWLARILEAHQRGETIVGGAIDIPDGLPLAARCDHYCGSYHVHRHRRAGWVANHPPANLSVRRDVFLGAGGFAERFPVADGHEELPWQAAARRAGERIWFEPEAVVRHHNRPGISNLLRRNYRWGYSSLESKATTGAARAAWLYRHPRLLIAAGAPFALAHTVYTVACWVRAGVLEPLALTPAVLMARVAYAAGYMVGGARWLGRRRSGAAEERPRWR